MHFKNKLMFLFGTKENFIKDTLAEIKFKF